MRFWVPRRYKFQDGENKFSYQLILNKKEVFSDRESIKYIAAVAWGK